MQREAISNKISIRRIRRLTLMCSEVNITSLTVALFPLLWLYQKNARMDNYIIFMMLLFNFKGSDSSMEYEMTFVTSLWRKVIGIQADWEDTRCAVTSSLGIDIAIFNKI